MLILMSVDLGRAGHRDRSHIPKLRSGQSAAWWSAVSNVYAWRPCIRMAAVVPEEQTEKEDHVVPPRTIGSRAHAARSTDRGLQHRRDGALDRTQADGYGALDRTQADGYGALGRTQAGRHAALAAGHHAAGHYAGRHASGHHASRAVGHHAHSARESHPAGQRR
jgi:hypothetical protein